MEHQAVHSDRLAALFAVIESRLPARGGDPGQSYVARLLQQGPDAFLKKIGEEATEVVLAAKDAQYGQGQQKIVTEMADLWFHSLIVLAYYGLQPDDVLAELERRRGIGGLAEKAQRQPLRNL